ncbi:MAG: nicotinate-nucleotide adenylyltransferase [Acidobacteriota bacterium]
MRIGIFGGTFDPVHSGHLAIAETVRRRLDLDVIRLVPCHQPPHKVLPNLTPGADRLAMIALATQDHPALIPCSLELVRRACSYTIDTLEAMQAAAPGAQLFFLMGMDSFVEIETWKDHERLVANYHLVVVNRPGTPSPGAGPGVPAAVRGRMVEGAAGTEAPGGRVHLLQVEPQEISSSAIRQRARRGQSISGMVSPPVESYIGRCALYREP